MKKTRESKQKKILIFLYNYKNKSETFIHDEIKSIIANKLNEVKILHYGTMIETERVIGLNIPTNYIKRILFCPKKNILKYITNKLVLKGILTYFINYFKDKEYDTIYCHFGPNGELIAELMELKIINKNTNLVVRFHGFEIVKKRYNLNSYQKLAKYANKVIVGSEYAKNELLNYKIPESKIEKIPVGVNQINIIPTISEKKLNKPIKIVSIGRLVEFKGHYLGIKAIKELDKKQIDFTYTIIGEGPEYTKLKKLIISLKLEEKIILKGGLNHEETISELKTSDIYIYTGIKDKYGREETQGLANIEAMALGLPVLTTNIGGVSEYLIDRETGIVLNNNKHRQIGNRLRWMIANYNSYTMLNIRSQALELIKHKYNQTELHNKLIKVL